jgi:hemerythrin-like domain-containing protein
MLTITQALALEHRVFSGLFDQIEQTLPGFDALAEVHLLARSVEGLLRQHSEAEDELVALALAEGARHRRWCRALLQQHQEIDSSLTGARATGHLGQARRLLRAAIAASRRHFEFEDRVVFPRLENVLPKETLTRLGRIWFQQRDWRVVYGLTGLLHLRLDRRRIRRLACVRAVPA